ncbi:MAG: NAD(P)-dependent glycerol-3-phosphate dehydrogenase [Armatimonadetes bacterium]|nr:MAG: NAD(P)-dependent glycerol-3-phosphate dehydrogenase [Armatimonadota bacterium]
MLRRGILPKGTLAVRYPNPAVESVVVLGAGSWGTALSLLIAKKGCKVFLRARSEEAAARLDAARENRDYLPGFHLPENVEPCYALPRAADLWLVAVPSDAVREVAPLLPDECRVLMTAKGLERSTGLTMTQVLLEERPSVHVAVMSGPNLGLEIVRGVPTATVVASEEERMAEYAAGALRCESLRVYTSADVMGVQMGGALKNVLAVGAGISDGLGFGDNTKASMLARGLHEMAVLGTALGGRVETFMGLSGVGDLFATAASPLSRNYRFGRLLGEGRTTEEALKAVGQVVEGVPTAEAAVGLAEKHGIEAPLLTVIHQIVQGRLAPREAVSLLMSRAPRSEGLCGESSR